MFFFSCNSKMVPGHPAELSDSVKLLLTDAKNHVFEIDLVLKSIHRRFLYKRFNHFGLIVCLQVEFEVKAEVLQLDAFVIKIKNPDCLPFWYFLKKSFQRDKTSHELRIN